MGSKFIVPLSLLEVSSTPAIPIALWHKMYFKNGHLKHLTNIERDLVLDRPLDGFTVATLCSQILPTDTVLEAFEKLQCQVSSVTLSNADWNSTSGHSEILNKPILSLVATSGDYNDLLNLPIIPVMPTLALVATTGDYNDLLNTPSLFSGNYNDLFNLPILFDGDYNSLINIPVFANVAFSGDYADLMNAPVIPVLPTLATVATTGDYNDLLNLPVIPTLPVLATVATSGDYNDLINLPNLSDYVPITGGTMTGTLEAPTVNATTVNVDTIVVKFSIWTIDLMDALTTNVYAPHDMKITSTVNITNSPVITILVNNLPYSFGTNITIGSQITISASIAGVTNLNISR